MDNVPKYFFDTCTLLNYYESIFNSTDKFAISEVTLRELESIKTSYNKSDEVKYKARQVTKLLAHNQDKYDVILMVDRIFNTLEVMELEDTPDNRIIMTATYYYQNVSHITFVTDDLCLYNIAKQITPIPVKLGYEVFENSNKDEIYKGYKIVCLEDNDMATFYENLKTNIYDCLENKYLIIKNTDNETKDIRRWTTKDGYVEVFNKAIKSNSMGAKIKPKDDFQRMAIDSIFNNTMTVISGKAGSGKSLLSLSSAMNLIESDKYKSLVILYNPVKVKGASDLGFYTGSAVEKAMQNSIGEILRTKFNDIKKVEAMIMSGQIKLLSMADCRGTEIKDDEILWITEAQNTSIELIKLCLSRCSQHCKIIIEGDYNSQVDNYVFSDGNNGMKRAIEVLKGEDIFGYIELQNVWRSKIASLMDKL